MNLIVKVCFVTIQSTTISINFLQQEYIVREKIFGQLKISIALLAVLGLSACGGGGGSSVSPAAFRGQFVDANVSGLNWKTATRSGVTDANGYFEYDTAGEKITFSINDTPLGTVNADKSIHVFDLSQSLPDQLSEKGSRLAQLLQTLDSDGDTSNGIQLTPEVKAKFSQTTAIDFHAEQNIWDSQLTQIANNVGKPVVAMDVAFAHALSNVNRNTDCAIPVKDYLIDGTPGYFSSSKLNCSQRAALEAFFYHVSPSMANITAEMNRTHLAYLNDGAIDEIEKSIINDSVIKAGLATVIDAVKFNEDITGKSFSAKELFAHSVKYINDITKVICSQQFNDCNSDNAATSARVANLIISELSTATSCTKAKDLEACGKFVSNLLESKDVTNLLLHQMTPTEVQDVVGITVLWLKAISDAAAIDPKGTNIYAETMNVAGSFAEATLKTIKLSAGVDNVTYSKLIDVVGEGVNVGLTCAGVKGAPLVSSH